MQRHGISFSNMVRSVTIFHYTGHFAFFFSSRSTTIVCHISSIFNHALDQDHPSGFPRLSCPWLLCSIRPRLPVRNPCWERARICRDLDYLPQYHLLCVNGYNDARRGSLNRWFPRGSGRQASLRESMCAFRGEDCDYPHDCCTGRCSASTYTCN